MEDVDGTVAGAFDACYAATAQQVARQVFLVSGDVADTEDAVHAAYARAWQDWARVGRLAAPESWVRREAMAVRPWRGLVEALGLRRKRAGVEAYGLDTANVLQALDRLPAHQRVAVVLHEVAGLGLEELAAEMESTPGAARMRVARGRKAFAAALAELERVTGPPEDVLERARARLLTAAARPRFRLLPAEDVRRLGVHRQRLLLAGVAGLVALVVSLVGFAWWHEEEPPARRVAPSVFPTATLFPGGVAAATPGWAEGTTQPTHLGETPDVP